MDTTISDDEFIETVVSSAKREVHELSEEHIIFPGPDPQVLIHIWHENGFYFSGISERSYNPRGAVRANDLTTVKQWLVMELFDFLRLSWHLEDIGIAFRWLSPAPNWSQDPGGVWVFRTVCFERVVLSSPGCLWPGRMDDHEEVLEAHA